MRNMDSHGWNTYETQSDFNLGHHFKTMMHLVFANGIDVYVLFAYRAGKCDLSGHSIHIF